MSKPSEPETGAAVAEAIPVCPHCQKPLPLCICDSIKPIESRTSLLILQHPQEQDRALGTARLTALHFKDAVLKIGLGGTTLTAAKNIKQLGSNLLLLTSLEDLAVFRPVAEVLGDHQVLPSLWLLPVRDLVALGVWAFGFAGNTIVWRGQRFELKDGRLRM